MDGAPRQQGRTVKKGTTSAKVDKEEEETHTVTDDSKSRGPHEEDSEELEATAYSGDENNDEIWQEESSDELEENMQDAGKMESDGEGDSEVARKPLRRFIVDDASTAKTKGRSGIRSPPFADLSPSLFG